MVPWLGLRRGGGNTVVMSSSPIGLLEEVRLLDGEGVTAGGAFFNRLLLLAGVWRFSGRGAGEKFWAMGEARGVWRFAGRGRWEELWATGEARGVCCCGVA